MPIRFCPKCGSTDFEEVREGNVMGDFTAPYGDTPKLRCKKCGYTAKIFPEVETKEELEKIKEGLKKFKKDDQ